MKKLGPIAYRSLFFKHVWRFIGNVASKKELNRNHAVAVSGGLDSMTLLWFVHCLSKEGKIGAVRAIFVNHHTRSGQNNDRDVVANFCKELGIPFVELHVTGLSKFQSNFEARARKMRRDLCIKELKNDELLWVGHHLDDSFEWNFMQRNRSTNPKSTIGIPVRNKKIIRPFLCVTRDQIQKVAKFESIPYLDDPTNKDLKHDRNYVRHAITPLIKKRYPKYLKFYSHFANFSAMALKISAFPKGRQSKIYVFEDGAAIIGKQFSELQIQELIHNYSLTDRGEIVTAIERMLKAIQNDKKGPFHFSGGMEAYYTPGFLMIYRQKMQNHDVSIAHTLKTLSGEALSSMPKFKKSELEQAWRNLLKTSDAMMNLPGLVLVLETDSVCKTLNTSVYDPLFPHVSALCKERGWRFTTYQKCIDVWKRKKEKLPESLRLIPLSNLSNLFASQE